MVKELFAAIDAKDAQKFASFLDPDCAFRFGNGPPVRGSDEIQRYVAGFFGALKSLSHEVLDDWTTRDAVLCHGLVTYVRQDSSSLQVPFANVLKMKSGKVKEYLIFADTSELFRA
jgi:ketosteroid isomerase-like protein